MQCTDGPFELLQTVQGTFLYICAVLAFDAVYIDS